MKKLAIYAASSALIFAACSGDETTNVTEVNESTGLDVVAKGEKMPACDTANVGQMIFVTDSSAVYYCANEKWATLNGKDGAAGKDGEDGKDGTNGKDGTKGDDCSIVSDADGVVRLACGSGTDTTTVYKAMCGMKPYDPADHFCDERDFQVYRYVEINGQVWMAENLNYNYNEGSAISVCYQGDDSMCEKYGRLYRWSAAMDSVKTGCGQFVSCSVQNNFQGVCPDGWHLTSMSEWEDLIAAAQKSGVSLHSKTEWLWSTNFKSNDQWSFSVLPAGYAWNIDNGVISERSVYLLERSEFWTSDIDENSTEKDVMYDYPYTARFFADGRAEILSDHDRNHTFSVRCIKN